MTFDPTVKLSDLLTSATILISAIALLISWSKDRDLQTRKDADQIRGAAAKCISKLDRWRNLQLSMYDELQSAYVVTSELVAEHPENLGAARDYLWKAITTAQAKSSSRVSEEQIETAYADLLAAYPQSRRDFLSILNELQAFEEKALDGLLASTQNAVLNVSLRDYSPPVLGNALRNAATKTRERFMADTAAALEGFRERFYGIVVLSDREIVAARWRPETDSKTGSAPASSHDTDTER